MPPVDSILGFALVALVMVTTPGPNMIYLISRSLCQGTTAGLISLAGVVTGLTSWMFAAAFGLTATLIAIPGFLTVVQIAGAAYLAYLAYNALKPGGASVFEVRKLTVEEPKKLYFTGVVTVLLNPKVAVK